MLPLPPPAGTSHPRSPGEPAPSLPAVTPAVPAAAAASRSSPARAPRLPKHSGTSDQGVPAGLALCGAAALPEGRRSRRPEDWEARAWSGEPRRAGARADYSSRHAALFRGGRGRGTPGCGVPALRELPALPQSPREHAAVLLPAHEDSEPRWRVSLERPRFPQGVPRRRR